MSFNDALAKARANRPAPVLQAVALGGELFQVEIRRLDGMDWSAITAECPPKSARDVGLGYDSNKAAFIACKQHGRLLDKSGEPVSMAPLVDESGKVESDPWVDLFNEISGTESDAITATWWQMNVNDPNTRVVALKKALAAGDKTSSN